MNNENKIINVVVKGGYLTSVGVNITVYEQLHHPIDKLA